MAQLTMPALEALEALAARAYQALRRYPNVHSVAISKRERGGKTVDELVLTVFVSKKVAPSALAAEAAIPAEFEGFPTDVVEMPEIDVAELGEIPGMPADDNNEDEGRYRPLKGGMQIQGSAWPGSKGTLGLLAKVQGDTRVVGITNWHVLFDNSHPPAAGVRVGNPGMDDSCTGCAKGSFGTVIGQDYTAVDVAIGRLDPNTEWLAEIQCIGNITGWNTANQVDVNSGAYKVRKYGRTTRLTGGTLRSIVFTTTVNAPDRPPRPVTGGLLIEPNRPLSGGAVKFLDEGDSGSALVNAANEVIAVIYGGILKDRSAARYGWGVAFSVTSMATRIQAAHGFQLIAATATRLGDVQRTPAAGAAAAIDAAAAEAAALAARLEAELSSTERGRLIAALWMRHSNELHRLVNTNRKVATLWHRNRGPALFQHAIRAARLRDVVIPDLIDGHSVDECVANILATFSRYGSDALKADLQTSAPVFPALAGRSFQELLGALEERG